MLVATERGASGPDPPGDVYLISLDDLRTTRLAPGEEASGRRLEYIGFSNSGREVFVTRQFYLDIYDLEGMLTRSVELEYHAKPTHMIAGLFGSYVLVGDTVGHLMLADTSSGRRIQLSGGQHGDAALFIESDPSATRAIVIFESGLASLVDLYITSKPVQQRLDVEGVVFAAFSSAVDSRRFLTADKNGALQVWSDDRGQARLDVSLDHEGVSVGLASFSRDELRVISLDARGVFRRWDIESSKLLSADEGAANYDVILTEIGWKNSPWRRGRILDGPGSAGGAATCPRFSRCTWGKKRG